MALRSCLVSCRDLAGTQHAVEVTAESLYEAVAQALGILRGDMWVEEIGEGLTELKVRVNQPAVEHRVRMKGFRKWLESNGKTPGRVHTQVEADGVGERGSTLAVIWRWNLAGLPFRKAISRRIQPHYREPYHGTMPP
jgi:hypothetical protein